MSGPEWSTTQARVPGYAPRVAPLASPCAAGAHRPAHPSPGSRPGLLAAALAAALAAPLAGCTPEPCPRPLVECDGICIDVASDVDHCGRCGRACGGGLGCVAGQCVPDPGASCTSRSGGAFVTLEVCTQAVKLWTSSGAFADQADAMRTGAAPARIPVFDLRAGADCDDQWSFHPDPATPAFADVTVELCDACPSSVQADLPYWLGTVRQWCPWTARVVAVDRRP